MRLSRLRLQIEVQRIQNSGSIERRFERLAETASDQRGCPLGET